MLVVNTAEPTDPFELRVFRQLSTVCLDGSLSANLLIPNCDYGLDEQDIIVVTKMGVCTIDAKAYEPGQYRGGLNGPLQWRRNSSEGFVEVEGRLAKPLSTAANKAKKIVSILQQACRSPEVNLRYLPRNIRVLSLIVVPDHAGLVEPEILKTEQTNKITVPCKMLNLSALNELLELCFKVAPADKSEEAVDRLIRKFGVMLRDWVPSRGSFDKRVGKVRLIDRVKVFDNEVRGEAWKGIAEGENVFVKVFFKYPWREHSEAFFRQVNLQARALRQARLPHVVSLNAVYDYPQYVAMVFEWFENEGTLESAITTLHGLPVPDSVALFRRIAGTIELLHENPGRASVVSRCVHPEDILLRHWKGPTDWSKVDFLLIGFDKAVIRGRSSAGVAGASPYDAPEMSGRDSGTGRREPTVDIFSLGMLLMFILTGMHPLTGEHLVPKEIPTAISSVIRRTTRPRASERYQTVSELLRDLG